VDEVPPVVVLYFPAAHEIHAVDPVDGWYLPVSQLSQSAAKVAAEMDEALPTSQEVHDDFSEAVWYVPLAQDVQAEDATLE